LRYFFHLHIGKLIGIALYVIALFFYRSYENKPVFGIWSYQFFMVIIISLVLLLIALISTWSSLKKKKRKTRLIASVSTYIDLAILFWGISYFLSAIDSTVNASRIVDLNIFGSIVPVAVFLEWVTMDLLFIAIIIFIAPRLKNKLKNPMLMVFTVVGLFLLCEGAIRIRAIVAPFSQGFPTNTSILWGRYYTNANREGFRDVEHLLDKPQGTRRILTVGDSFAYGWGVNNIEDRFSEQLATKLTEKSGDYWETINASKFDSHTLDHIKFLKQALPYKPDVIILLYVFNDIDYLSSITPRPNLTSRLDLTSILYRNFYLFQEIYFRLRLIKAKYQENNERKSDPYNDSTLVSHHLKDISKFVELAEKADALVWVVPFDISVVSETARLSRYNEFVNQARAFGIPVIPLDNEFEGFQISQLTVNKFDSHPNEFANRIAAEEAAKSINEKINYLHNSQL